MNPTLHFTKYYVGYWPFFFLWRFDPIPGHGLPLRDFAITLGTTPLDE